MGEMSAASCARGQGCTTISWDLAQARSHTSAVLLPGTPRHHTCGVLVLLMIVATVSATAAVAQVSYSQQGAVAPGASSFSASRKLLFTASRSGSTMPVRRASLNMQRGARDSGGGGVVWRRTPKGANKLRGAPPSVGGLDWKDAVRTPVCLINASSCGVHTSLTTDGATGGRRRDGTGFTTLHVMEVKRRSAGCWQLASLAMRLQSPVKRRFMLPLRRAGKKSSKR